MLLLLLSLLFPPAIAAALCCGYHTTAAAVCLSLSAAAATWSAHSLCFVPLLCAAAIIPLLLLLPEKDRKEYIGSMYQLFMTAAEKLGDVDWALRLHQAFLKGGKNPSRWFHPTAVKMLAEAGRLREAADIAKVIFFFFSHVVRYLVSADIPEMNYFVFSGVVRCLVPGIFCVRYYIPCL